MTKMQLNALLWVLSMANIYRALIDLLPQTPLMVATVQSVDINGTSTVEFSGGGTAVVRGTSIGVGGKCFVRNGLIEGAAPDLPLVEIEV